MVRGLTIMQIKLNQSNIPEEHALTLKNFRVRASCRLQILLHTYVSDFPPLNRNHTVYDRCCSWPGR